MVVGHGIEKNKILFRKHETKKMYKCFPFGRRQMVILMSHFRVKKSKRQLTGRKELQCPQSRKGMCKTISIEMHFLRFCRKNSKIITYPCYAIHRSLRVYCRKQYEHAIDVLQPILGEDVGIRHHAIFPNPDVLWPLIQHLSAI